MYLVHINHWYAVSTPTEMRVLEIKGSGQNMGQIEKLLQTILCGHSDKNIKFADLCHLLQHFGFRERIKGDHFIYTKDGIAEKINIQPNGAMAKPYQVKQVRNIIVKYHLACK